MKVLVTGAKGFIGKNLVTRLKEEKNIEILEFDKDDSFELIENNISSIDFIYHLAGVNRPTNNSEFYSGNTDLTKQIIDLINSKNLSIPLLITSSIQALKDNDYGKSKKQAEDIVLKYGEKNKSYVFRLNNVFGKWCKPNYNSVIATFCYNIAHNIDITINDKNTELELIYIDDIINKFIELLYSKDKNNNDYYYIEPSYKKTLGELVTLIRDFKNNMESISVPETGNEFTKKLFSTYLSYIELDDMVITPVMNVDDRGSFTELIKTMGYGQVSISISKPGVFRGNHYHHTKMERFIVIKGMAKITFRHIITNEIKEYLVDDKNLEIINIPVGYTHKIENIGKDEMILLLWCNEIFDKNQPDTYFMEV